MQRWITAPTAVTAEAVDLAQRLTLTLFPAGGQGTARRNARYALGDAVAADERQALERIGAVRAAERAAHSG